MKQTVHDTPKVTISPAANGIRYTHHGNQKSFVLDDAGASWHSRGGTGCVGQNGPEAMPSAFAGWWAHGLQKSLQWLFTPSVPTDMAQYSDKNK